MKLPYFKLIKVANVDIFYGGPYVISNNIMASAQKRLATSGLENVQA
jgi:hypothetical protein